jgi:hypothetical protein
MTTIEFDTKKIANTAVSIVWCMMIVFNAILFIIFSAVFYDLIMVENTDVPIAVLFIFFMGILSNIIVFSGLASKSVKKGRK